MKIFTTISLVVCCAVLWGCGGDGGNPSAELLTDIEGHKYKTIKIGDQTWMAENLRVTSFCDGTGIHVGKLNKDGVSEVDQWKYDNSRPQWCYHNDDPAIGEIYGCLYNLAAVVDSECLCPTGWRVPTEIDWQLLIDFLGSSSGAKLKEEGYDHWKPSGEAINAGTNESGFKGLPASKRDLATFYNMESEDIGYNTRWWASDNIICNEDYFGKSLRVYYDSPESDIECVRKGHGCSVRCIKNQ